MPPFEVVEEEKYAIVTFPEYGDALRRPSDEQRLEELVSRKFLVIFDLAVCKSLDTPWLRLITSLSKRADTQGRRVVVAGATPETMSSADFLGQRKFLHEAASVDAAVRELSAASGAQP